MSEEDNKRASIKQRATMFDIHFSALEVELEIDSRIGATNRHLVELATSLKSTITAFAAKEIGHEELAKRSLVDAASAIKSLVDRMLSETEEFEKRSLVRREKWNALKREIEDEQHRS